MRFHAAVLRATEKMARAVAIVGGLGLLVAIAVTCLSALGKFARRSLAAIFGADIDPAWLSWIRPILGEEEIVQYAVGFALFAALPWFSLRRGQIAVNLLEKRLPDRVNIAIDLVGNLILSAVAYLIMTRQWRLLFKNPRAGDSSLLSLLWEGDFAAIAARMLLRDESQILALPMAPFYVVAEFCAVLLFVAYVLCVWGDALALARGRRHVGA